MSEGKIEKRENEDIAFLNRLNPGELCYLKSRETKGHRPVNFGVCVMNFNGESFTVWKTNTDGRIISESKKENISAEEIVQTWWVD